MSQLPQDSQYLPQEEGFSMSREDSVPEAMNSPTGLSGKFPTCNVTDNSSISGARDLLSGVLREVTGSEDAEALLREPDDAPQQVQDEFLEDAQRLEDQVYHELQPPKKSCDAPSMISDCDPPPNQLAVRGSPSLLRSVKSHLSDLDAQPHKRFRVEEEKSFNLRGATAVGPPPGPLAIRLTSAIGRADTSTTMDLTKNGEPGFIPHDFPWDGPDCTVPDPSPESMGDSRFMAVKELAAGSVMRTIPIDRSVSFLLVVRDSDDQLFIPSLPFFDMVVNLMESTIITKHPDLYTFYWSSSKWRNCGFLDLPVDSVPMLEQWRVVLSNLVLNDVLRVDTFPKDSLLLGPDVTVLLKETHLSYDISRMNLSVVCRNKSLQGYVRVTCSKNYFAHDITRHSINMNGWRMVYLAGDNVFMEYLSRCPVTQRFIVGPGTVIIRGGIRKPSFLSEQARAQFTWTRASPSPSSPYIPPLSLQPDPSLGPPVASVGPTDGGGEAIVGGIVVPVLSKTKSAPAGTSSTKKSATKPKNRSSRLKAKKNPPACC